MAPEFPAAQALRRQGVTLSALVEDGLALDAHGELDLLSLETTVKYEGYLKQEALASGADQEGGAAPHSRLGFRTSVPGLSREVVQRLSRSARKHWARRRGCQE